MVEALRAGGCGGRLARRRRARTICPARLAPRTCARGSSDRHRRRAGGGRRAAGARAGRNDDGGPLGHRRAGGDLIHGGSSIMLLDARHRQHRDHRWALPGARARGALADDHEPRPHAGRVGRGDRRLPRPRRALAQRGARRVSRVGRAGRDPEHGRGHREATGCTGVAIDARSPLPVTLDVDEPLSVGADRIVNALAAVELYRRRHDRGGLRHRDDVRLHDRRRAGSSAA